MESDSDSESDSVLIECNGIGNPVYIDPIDQKKFYLEYNTGDLRVKVGDCVRVRIGEHKEADMKDVKKGKSTIEEAPEFAFGQVMAVYEDSSEIMLIEIRWIVGESELKPSLKKSVSLLSNELVETDRMDDIPAGSVVQVIKVVEAPEKSLSEHHSNSSSSSSTTMPAHMSSSTSFVCRYLEMKGSRTLQKVARASMIHRGMQFSDYSVAYEKLFSSDSAEFSDDPYAVAIRNLHLSVIPVNLPCRGKELASLQQYILVGLRERKQLKPVYISGMPGTGKTATVLAAVNSLKEEVLRGRLVDFNFVEINCLMLKHPLDAYTALWRGLSGLHVSPKIAVRELTRFFARGSVDKEVELPCTVCLVDEMDYLLSKDSTILYNFFSWPMQSQSGLIFIGVANTTNLPEVLTSRLQSRLDIHREVFKPYSHDQVLLILQARLADLSLEVFSAETKVIEFMARKAIIVAGDLRVAMKICQRFVEMLWACQVDKRKKAAGSGDSSPKDDGKIPTQVMMKMVNDAVGEFRQNSFSTAVAKSSLLDQAVLLLLSRHRLQCTGSEGGDDDAARSEQRDAALTADELWDRLSDVSASSWPPITAEDEDDDDVSEEGLAIQIPAVMEDGSGEEPMRPPGKRKRGAEDHRPEDDSQLLLLLPPFYLFERALDGLLTRSLLFFSTSKTCANLRSGKFHLHPCLAHADILTAVKGTCLEKFCRSERA